MIDSDTPCCYRCKFFIRSLTRGKALGRCVDPSKDITDTLGAEVRSRVRFPLEVYPHYVCMNFGDIPKGRVFVWENDKFVPQDPPTQSGDE